MGDPKILVAGVGNIFLGDDAFGVEVVAQLRDRSLPPQVLVVDFGIRGLDLTYALLDGYDAVILVDAVPRGGPPGTLYVLEQKPLDAAAAIAGPPPIEAHRLEPARVLHLVSALGGRVERLLVVGCEPVPLDEFEDIRPGLSDAARAAVPLAVDRIVQLVDELLGRHEPAANPLLSVARPAQQPTVTS
ncbi:MAG: hydrogenase maturation protease [Pirellulales bacterium]